ncbi:CusA/CzcA family heavy metal efflux RND transporter [Zunongwangia endophytica]|uniref:CusA/CzcA family heavy metal efflux RND transporter n=1 Tax=Zunongwangia endophytica TaxID=1808945 RepID=A0ABV8H892_9FLAO|nr:CusA/CzcA family heavy metal efflux RND transporter [Zunongwangia endophytica]MDN3595510.1 CusA/CzcA family heavy metal efflux RND transporter [Zunongwangia endophytica]
MINRIIDFSVNNKFIVGLFTIVLIAAGVWSMQQVPVDAQPDITNNQIQIITQAPNLGTEDIEQFVTYPVEVAMGNLPEVKEIRSVSRFGLSVVTIVFNDDVGTYLPRQLVAEQLSKVKKEIPEGFGEPFMGPISTGLGEIYQYTLEVDPEFKDEYTPTKLRSIQDWIVKRQFAMVPGVVEVNSIGGKIKQYEVAVNPDDLRSMQVTMAEVFEALQNNNQNTGGAYIEKNHQANFIRGEGLTKSISDIENIVVKNEKFPITIADVARVRIGNAIRFGVLTKNGNGEAVGGSVLMLKGANSNEVVENVKNRIAQIQKSLPEGVSIKPFLDRSELIANTTATVRSNLLEGGLIVIFVLVLLLGNFRGGLIVASTIPLSLFFAFILMNIFDVWANLMSLGAIDFGIIVDGAVIIVESTVFIFSRKSITDKLHQTEKNKLVSTSSKKMMNSAFFGQAIILIVFLPILALEGVEGKMFKPMALTFIFAMLGAMILCLTYVPMISALFLKNKKSKKLGWGDRFVRWLQQKYEPLLQKSLKASKWIVCSAAILLVFAGYLFSRMGGEFIPQLDEGDLAFHVILKPGSSLSEGGATSTKIENLLLNNFPEVEQVVTRFGVSEVPTDPMPMDIGDSFLILKPKSEWTSAKTKDQLIKKMKQTISEIPGVSCEFTQPVEMRFNELLTGIREDVAVKLYGEDLNILAEKAQEIGNLISGIEGVADMKVEATAGLPQITVDYDRSQMARYGVTIESVNQMIETAFAGSKAGVVFEGERKFDLVVRLEEENRQNISNIEQLYINLPDGSSVPLSELATISYQPGPMQISRDNTNRRTYVGINIRDRDVKSVVHDIQNKLDAELELPAGYFIRYGGAFENLERASERLKIVVPIALLLIFILIYFALKSFKQTLMIYMAIPLAAIGGIISLWLRGMPFSISAGVGFIVLFGVAVLNGLVLISSLNELKEEGETNLKQRISRGTKRRIRPILLTALTDVLGFLPMAISSSAGAEVQRPLATVVIGGLITSTLLTLFVLPILYKWVEEVGFNFRINNRKLAGAGFIVLMILPNFSNAQEIELLPEVTMHQAVEIGLENYPLLKNKQLEVEKEEALKKNAWDFGKTTIFTAGEELDNGNGVYTRIGFSQQNINVFGIASALKLQKEKLKLAENQLNLSKIEVATKIRKLWGEAYVAKRKFELYKELDSIYGKFNDAVNLRYEVEEISELEKLNAQNKVNQILVKARQSKVAYINTLSELNLWLGESQDMTVASSLLMESIENSFESTSSRHPYLDAAEQRKQVAEANFKKEKSTFLPTLNLQYGQQEVEGEDGYVMYQAGISIPFLSGKSYGNTKAAKIDAEIANRASNFAKQEFLMQRKQALQKYQSWKISWEYYEQEALTIAEKQRKGTIIAYNEGALDYVAFIQNLEEALQTELDAIDAAREYVLAYAEIKFYSVNEI